MVEIEPSSGRTSRKVTSHHFGRDYAHLTPVILNGRGRMTQGWGAPSRYDPNDAGITQTR